MFLPQDESAQVIPPDRTLL